MTNAPPSKMLDFGPQLEMSSEHVLLDILMAAAAMAIFLVYHVVLLIFTIMLPRMTTIGQNHAAKRAWCAAMTGRPDYGILAVQTLRNGMMASQLLASTSFTITSALALIIVTTDWKTRTFGFRTTGVSLLANEASAPPIKLFILVLCFACAFVCCLLSIRAYHQASFLITVPAEFAESVGCRHVARILIRGANFHTVGTRAYYAAFLILLWLFGPIPMIVASPVVVCILYTLDYVRIPEKLKESASSGATAGHTSTSLSAPRSAGTVHSTTDQQCD